ncbi:MAG TPA: hypothetical protein ENI23_07780 [bacterium]|nr:hypothetical protein [bacterium]
MSNDFTPEQLQDHISRIGKRDTAYADFWWDFSPLILSDPIKATGILAGYHVHRIPIVRQKLDELLTAYTPESFLQNPSAWSPLNELRAVITALTSISHDMWEYRKSKLVGWSDLSYPEVEEVISNSTDFQEVWSALAQEMIGLDGIVSNLLIGAELQQVQENYQNKLLTELMRLSREVGIEYSAPILARRIHRSATSNMINLKRNLLLILDWGIHSEAIVSALPTAIERAFRGVHRNKARIGGPRYDVLFILQAIILRKRSDYMHKDELSTALLEGLQIHGDKIESRAYEALIYGLSID